MISQGIAAQVGSGTSRTGGTVKTGNRNGADSGASQQRTEVAILQVGSGMSRKGGAAKTNNHNKKDQRDGADSGASRQRPKVTILQVGPGMNRIQHEGTDGDATQRQPGAKSHGMQVQRNHALSHNGSGGHYENGSVAIRNRSPGSDADRQQDFPSNHQGVEQDTPTPWKDSSAKTDLVRELCDPNSTIRKMSIKSIHESDIKYKRYSYKQFYQNVYRLAKKYEVSLPIGGKNDGSTRQNNIINASKNGSSDKTNNKITSEEDNDSNSEKKKVVGWKGCQARKTILKLLMDKKSSIHTMTNMEIYESHLSFQEFERKYFLRNLKNLQKMAAADLVQIEKQEDDFQYERNRFPREELTAGGYPFWDSHSASLLMKEDVESGLVLTLKPAKLRALRDEYKAFPLQIFRTRIYAEQRAQREANYWIVKRNRDAQKKRDEETQKYKDEWEESQFDEKIAGLCKQWEQWNAR
jgi:hypothetical protein